jgi:transmembrane sensor
VFRGGMNTDNGNDGSASSPGDYEALARYLAGESSPAEEAELRRLLDASAEDAALVASMQRAFNRLPVTASAGDIDVDAAFRRVKAMRDETRGSAPLPAFTVARGSAPRIRPRGQAALTRRSWIAPAIAAAAVLAIGITTWRGRGSEAVDPASAVAAAPQTLRTTVGSRDSILLSDGSRVVLAPMSELSFVASAPGGERVATLVGEGYFDVVHDEAHPFVVHAGGAEIRDIGTTFSVHGGDEHEVTVVVTSGVVELGTPQGVQQGAQPAVQKGTPQGKSPSPATPKSSVRLEKGDIGVRRADGSTSMRRRAATGDDIAWTRGALVFRDTPFRDVADRVRRWYGIELRTADSTIAARTVTADITGEGVDRVLQVLSLSLGAEVQRQGALAVFRDAERGGGGRR